MSKTILENEFFVLGAVFAKIVYIYIYIYIKIKTKDNFMLILKMQICSVTKCCPKS